MYGVVDTGTSLIAATKTYIDAIQGATGTVSGDCSNVPQLPSVTFVIGGAQYTIPGNSPAYELKGSDWVLEITTLGRSSCMSGFMSTAFPEEMKNFIILGDVFLRTVYTHWVYGDGDINGKNPPKIGFGPLA